MNRIKNEQLAFYKARKAGCIFAAICARDPIKYGWKHVVLDDLSSRTIDEIITNGIKEAATSTISLLFPAVVTNSDLLRLISELQDCHHIVLESNVKFENMRCLGFRVKVGENLSWVSGFGNFEFLPKTRRTPYTEIVFRVKPRPTYEWHMKPPLKGVLHLADTDMLGVPLRTFKKWWNASFKNTKLVLGHSPNLLSAAKTTYAIPVEMFEHD